MPTQTIEGLRKILLERVIESYGLTAGRVKWTPHQAARQIANFLPGLYGLVQATRDNTNPHRFWDNQTLRFEVQNLGFPSVPALLGALDGLRKSLKEELPAEDQETNT